MHEQLCRYRLLIGYASHRIFIIWKYSRYSISSFVCMFSTLKSGERVKLGRGLILVLLDSPYTRFPNSFSVSTEVIPRYLFPFCHNSTKHIAKQPWFSWEGSFRGWIIRLRSRPRGTTTLLPLQTRRIDLQDEPRTTALRPRVRLRLYSASG